MFNRKLFGEDFKKIFSCLTETRMVLDGLSESVSVDLDYHRMVLKYTQTYKWDWVGWISGWAGV